MSSASESCAGLKCTASAPENAPEARTAASSAATPPSNASGDKRAISGCAARLATHSRSSTCERAACRENKTAEHVCGQVGHCRTRRAACLPVDRTHVHRHGDNHRRLPTQAAKLSLQRLYSRKVHSLPFTHARRKSKVSQRRCRCHLFTPTRTVWQCKPSNTSALPSHKHFRSIPSKPSRAGACSAPAPQRCGGACNPTSGHSRALLLILL